jgi:predicted DNA-binding transcriptional regulator YafY
MSARRTERLLNLVICLLATRRWLTKEQIRAAVPQYADCESAEAFDRMFERDKEDLRELGVPLVTGQPSAWFEDEVGYRVDRDAYALPEVEFTSEELAVLGLASRVWQQASLAGPAARALVKLRALGVETDEGSLVGVEPRVRTAEPAFEPLYAATRDRVRVSFPYRRPDGQEATRHLEPWAMYNRSGRWYVVGRDTDREAPRAFRLSRVVGTVRRTGAPGAYQVPEDADPARMVGFAPEPADDRPALLRVRDGRGGSLRRRALPDEPVELVEPVEPVELVELVEPVEPGATGLTEGWSLVRVKVGDVMQLAQEVAGCGPDVLVLAPADLRQEVLRRLLGAAAAHRPAGATMAPVAAGEAG